MAYTDTLIKKKKKKYKSKKVAYVPKNYNGLSPQEVEDKEFLGGPENWFNGKLIKTKNIFKIYLLIYTI